MTKVLTAQAVQKLKPSGELPREVADSSVPGLYLVIYPSGKKSWALRFRRPTDRRTTKLVLGSVSTVADDKRDPDPVVGGHLTLAAARRLAGALKHEIATGKDPAANHQAEKRSVAMSAENTFSAAATDFITQHAKTKTRRWQDQARLLGLREAEDGLELADKGLASRWRDKPLSEIDADTAFRLIEEVRHKGVPGLERRNAEPSEARARHMHSVLSKLFAWLAEKRRVDANPADATRPAGLLHNVNPSAPSAEAIKTEAMEEDLANLAAAVAAAGIDPSQAVYVAGAREATLIKLRAGSNFDNTVLMTAGLPAKSVACFAPAAVFSGYQGVPEIETRTEASYQFEDTNPAPIVGSGGTPAAPVGSVWQMGVIAIKVRSWCAWAVAPGGAQVVNGVNW